MLKSDDDRELLDGQEGCGCKERILMVDDTEFNIIPVKRMINETFNVPVETAINGKIAVDMYQEAISKQCGCDKRAFRVIIMDIGMPVMGGEEATEHILKLMPKPKPGEEELTHIVACTSFTNIKLQENCINIGMKKVYTKPIKPPHLNEIMKNNFYRKKEE